MLDPIYSGLIHGIEMLIAFYYFSAVSERRMPTGRILLCGVVLYGLCSLANLLFRNNVAVNAVMTILANGLFGWCCFRNKLMLAVSYAILLSAVSSAWETASISVMSALTGSAFYAYNNDFVLLLMESLPSKAAYFFTILIVCRILKPTASAAVIPIGLLLLPAVTTACLFIFWQICAIAPVSQKVRNLLAAASLLQLFSTIALFLIYQNQIEREKEAARTKSENSRLQTDAAYYRLLEKQNEALLRYAHDAKNHLAVIQALNADPEIERYVMQLSGQLAEYSRGYHSGNRLLDVMLQKYSMECEKRGVKFTYDVKLSNLKQLEDIDMVAILGNLLDNAVTSAGKSEGREVSFTTAMHNGYSVIAIANSCDTPPRVSGNRLLSTKEDPEFHGVGLRSVANALKKYEGDYDWNYSSEEHLFSVTAVLGEKIGPALGKK